MADRSQKFVEITIGVLCCIAILLAAVVFGQVVYTMLYPEAKSVIPQGQMHCECYQRGSSDATK